MTTHTFKQPFAAMVILADLRGNELFRFEAGIVRPSETVRFEYPADGLRVTLDGARASVLEPPVPELVGPPVGEVAAAEAQILAADAVQHIGHRINIEQRGGLVSVWCLECQMLIGAAPEAAAAEAADPTDADVGSRSPTASAPSATSATERT